MKRIGAVALFGGAVLLSTHIIAPAEPPALRPELLTSALAALGQARPLVDQVDSQVERLRERLANPPAYPVPVRDPFRFGAPPPPPRGAAAGAPAAQRAAPLVPKLPQLIAIATDIVDGTPVHTALLAAGDDVRSLKAGDEFAGFSVARVGAASVVLRDAGTGRTFQIALQ